MPNLFAHSLLAKRILLKEREICLKNPGWEPFLEPNQDYLFLGTQGPDPLFYMGIIPFKGLHLITAIKKIGNRLHKLDGKKLFRNLIEMSYSIDFGKNCEEQKRFQAFIFGQFAHYLLDRECHPYILYESGFDDNGRITGKYHYQHTFFESQIDYCLAKHYKVEYFLKRPGETIPNRFGPLKIIDRYFVPVLEKTFDVKRLPKKMYSNGVNNFRSWITYSNNGSKMRVFLFGKTSLSATRLPSEVTEDVLNEKKELWLDPVSGEEHHESFLELHSKAYDILARLYEDIMTKGFNFETFSEYIDGRNYYGNLPSEKWKYHRKEK